MFCRFTLTPDHSGRNWLLTARGCAAVTAYPSLRPNPSGDGEGLAHSWFLRDNVMDAKKPSRDSTARLRFGLPEFHSRQPGILHAKTTRRPFSTLMNGQRSRACEAERGTTVELVGRELIKSHRA